MKDETTDATAAATTGTLYMIPTPIAEGDPWMQLPVSTGETLRRLDHFVVEELRTARRFLSAAGVAGAAGTGGLVGVARVSGTSRIGRSGCSTGAGHTSHPGKPIDTLHLAVLNEHTPPEELARLVEPLLAGHDVGLLSEAGTPGVADPGADLAALCHARGIKVVPLSGPCSIILALSASGLNGQSFAFNGYLPVKPPERAKAIRHYERRAQTEGQSQIFIEAPYRNSKLLDDLLSTLAPATRLTMAVDLLGPSQMVRTATVAAWRKAPKPDINKRPAVFIIK